MSVRPLDTKRCRSHYAKCNKRYHCAPSSWRLVFSALAMQYLSMLTSSFVHPSSPYHNSIRPCSAATTRLLPWFSAHASSPDANDEEIAKTMTVPEPPPTSPAYSLYHLILQNRACRTNSGDGDKGSLYKNCKSIPLAGVYDALSAKIFAQNGAPALFLSGFGVSASLLGIPDAGMTNLVEMEMTTRNVCAVVGSRPAYGSVIKG